MFSTIRCLTFLLTSVTLGSLIWAKSELSIRNEKLNETEAVSVQMIAPPPAVNQQSLEVAFEAYQFKRDYPAPFPRFDRTIGDRGITEKKAYENYKTVKIGPTAFESWSILGSTLAHEIEIHCHQNFLLITIADYLGLEGTTLAEQEAYLWEINQAKRFGLVPSETYLIETTIKRYYPLNFVKSNRPQVSRGFIDYLVRSSVLARE